MPDVNKIPDYSDDWYEEEKLEDQDNGYVEEYDITAAPNDFNIRTIFDFIESGAVKIPGFQRNYVWDQRRASKLIMNIWGQSKIKYCTMIKKSLSYLSGKNIPIQSKK